MRKIFNLLIVIAAISIAACGDSDTNGNNCQFPTEQNNWCGDGPPSTVNCECPNGTLHVTGEDCCLNNNGEKADDCECIFKEGVRLENGIPMTGSATTQDAEKVKAGLDELASWGSNYKLMADFVESNLYEIRKISGSATPVFNKENGKWIATMTDGMLNDTSAVNAIAEAFFYFAEDNMVAKLK